MIIEGDDDDYPSAKFVNYICTRQVHSPDYISSVNEIYIFFVDLKPGGDS